MPTGGGVEDGEALAEAAIREAKEETGLDVELTRLVGVYSRIGGMWNDMHAILFAAEPVGGELKTQPGETIEVAYFPFGQIPDELLFGHKQRIVDSIHQVTGIAVKQELNIPANDRSSRKELYDLRDQSGLSRQDFYLNRIAQADRKEVVEVSGA